MHFSADAVTRRMVIREFGLMDETEQNFSRSCKVCESNSFNARNCNEIKPED